MPKWIFILYIAIQGKIYTRDRLHIWGMIDHMTCPLCEVTDEIMDHLFFQCLYSKVVWSKLLEWQGYHRNVLPWTEEKLWIICYANGKGAKDEMLIIVLAGTIYFIWQERNHHAFQQKQRRAEVLIRLIVQETMCRGWPKPKLAARLSQLNFYP